MNMLKGGQNYLLDTSFERKKRIGRADAVLLTRLKQNKTKQNRSRQEGTVRKELRHRCTLSMCTASVQVLWVKF